MAALSGSRIPFSPGGPLIANTGQSERPQPFTRSQTNRGVRNPRRRRLCHGNLPASCRLITIRFYAERRLADVCARSAGHIWIQTQAWGSDGDLEKFASRARRGWKRRQRGQRTPHFILRTCNHTLYSTNESLRHTSLTLVSGQSLFSHRRPLASIRAALARSLQRHLCWEGNVAKRQGRADKGGRESKNETCRDQNQPVVRNCQPCKLLCTLDVKHTSILTQKNTNQ